MGGLPQLRQLTLSLWRSVDFLLRCHFTRGCWSGPLAVEMLILALSFSPLAHLPAVNEAPHWPSPITFSCVKLVIRGLAGHGFHCSFYLRYLPLDRGFQDTLRRSLGYCGGGVRRSDPSLGRGTLGSDALCLVSCKTLGKTLVYSVIK